MPNAYASSPQAFWDTLVLEATSEVQATAEAVGEAQSILHDAEETHYEAKRKLTLVQAMRERWDNEVRSHVASAEGPDETSVVEEEPTRFLIMRAVGKTPERTVGQVFSEVSAIRPNVSRATVRAELWRLKNLGYLTSPGEGRFQRTNKLETHLSKEETATLKLDG